MKSLNLIFCMMLFITGVFAQSINDARMGDADLKTNIQPYTGPEADTTGMTRIATNGNGTRGTGSFIITDFADVQVQPNQYCQTEPHLTINKNHPNNIVLSFNYAKWIYPQTMATFSQSVFSHDNYNNISVSPWIGSFTFPHQTNVSGDPSTAVDATGNLNVATIDGGSFLMERSNSPSFGVAWSTPVSGVTGATTVDKEMIVSDNLLDATSTLVNRLYSVWTDFTASPYPVKFNYSDDGGLTYNGLTTLSTRWGQGAHVQTGPNHEIYVAWSDYPYNVPGHPSSYPPPNIGFTRSINGNPFISPLYINIDNGSSTPWFGNGGIQWMNGSIPALNGTRANDFPVLAVDRSCNGARGRIYMTYAANNPGTTNGPSTLKSRIFVIYSDDDGDNWFPCNTNGIVDDNGDQNWLPWIAVDNSTGNVYVAYLKGNNLSNGTFQTCVFLAYSADNGVTFDNIQASDACYQQIALPEPPFPGGYAGDYIACDAYAGNIYVAWNANTSTLHYHYNILCSKLTASTPALISAGVGIDLNLNSVVEIGNPPNSPDNVLYEAYQNITTAADQKKFRILSGGTATFKAGNSIHFRPGLTTADDFAAKTGSLTHAYISPVDVGCTIPFRLSGVKGFGDIVPGDDKSDMSVSPNPFRNDFDLKYNVYKDENVSIDVYDSYGNKILSVVNNSYTLEGKYTVTVNLLEQTPGIYYIVINSVSKTEVKKVIKI